MILIAVRQEINTLDKLVVVHELEFAMKRAFCKVVYEVLVANTMWKFFLALSDTNCKPSFNVTAMFTDDWLLISRNQCVSFRSTKF